MKIALVPTCDIGDDVAGEPILAAAANFLSNSATITIHYISMHYIKIPSTARFSKVTPPHSLPTPYSVQSTQFA